MAIYDVSEGEVLSHAVLCSRYCCIKHTTQYHFKSHFIVGALQVNSGMSILCVHHVNFIFQSEGRIPTRAQFKSVELCGGT